MTQTLITPNQFRERYGTALPTQYIWRSENKVPYQRVGRQILYDTTVVDELASDGKLGKDPLLNILKLRQKD